MTMKDVAKKASVTESYVSKLERDLLSPSLNALHRICNALDTNIAFLFESQDNPSSTLKLVRANGRVSMQVASDRIDEGIQLEALIPSAPSNLLQVNIHVVQPGGGGHTAIKHEGQEFGMMLQGSLELTVDGKVVNLQEGDAFSFESSLGHTYRNSDKDACKILWVNTPPTF